MLTACATDEPRTIVVPAGGGGPTTAPPTATTTPRPGSLPHYGEPDYTYDLVPMCFCAFAGPVRITVKDGEVARAVMVAKRRPGKEPQKAPAYWRLTINDVIDAANDTSLDDVEVAWPQGQAWPSRVALDPERNAADDEITYLIRRVHVA